MGGRIVKINIDGVLRDMTEAELAETEAELEEEKTADEVWEELAEKNTKK